MDYELKLVEMKDLGECDAKESKIFIRKSASEQQQILTVLHESFHAALYELGFEDLYDNEPLINAMASSMYSLLRDNPFIVEHMEKFKK